MSIRYDDRARSGRSAPSAGQRTGSGSRIQSHKSETFTSPGTWTWPGNVTHVQVLLVGGGGGGAARAISPPSMPVPANGGGTKSGPGGGGGVRYEWEVPVSGPVPITVGAGGAGGTGGLPTPPIPTGLGYTNTQLFGQVGGDSSFGPISVGGGGGGGHGLVPRAPFVPTYCNAPANGGGAGSAAAYTTGGTYGCDRRENTITEYAGGAGTSFGQGRFGYGQSGSTSFAPQSGPLAITSGTSATANSGAGGNGWDTGVAITSPLDAGGAGGSGIVIVSWWE